MTCDPVAAAAVFAGRYKVVACLPHGGGNVHKTYWVCSEKGERFLVQRLNTRVFPKPALIQGNLRTVAAHVLQRLDRTPQGPGRRWEVPVPLATPGGDDLWTDAEGEPWRALKLIEGAHSLDTVAGVESAREVGWALGTFHQLVSDLPPERLADTLPGFHVTPLYVQRLREILEAGRPASSAEVDFCLGFVRERAPGAAILEDARASGLLCARPIHGDPKAGNVLFDDATGRAVAMVDLDTVKPGLAHYDIGDCLRSACNPLGEEVERWEDARFDLGLCRAALGGYLSAARGLLGPAERRFIYDAVRLIAFELGVRFLTDHLEGNVYFRTRRTGHNLTRALVQFRLTESIEAQETAIRELSQELTACEETVESRPECKKPATGRDKSSE